MQRNKGKNEDYKPKNKRFDNKIDIFYVEHTYFSSEINGNRITSKKPITKRKKLKAGNHIPTMIDKI